MSGSNPAGSFHPFRMNATTETIKPTVEWVAQNDTYGCGVAVLAMLFGISYQEAKARFPAYDPAKHGIHVDDVLVDFGYALATKWNTFHWRFFCNSREEPRNPWPPEPFASTHICKVRVTANSPCFHWVVMLADGKVLDPLTPEPKRLTDYDTVVSVSAVVPVGERAA